MLGIVHYQNTMARMLKRWESPRQEGRNDKGKGGSARQRQVKKQMKMLRKRLKDQGQSGKQGESHQGEFHTLPLFWAICGKLRIMRSQLSPKNHGSLGFPQLLANSGLF
jgi:hypothetical protein